MNIHEAKILSIENSASGNISQKLRVIIETHQVEDFISSLNSRRTELSKQLEPETSASTDEKLQVNFVKFFTNFQTIEKHENKLSIIKARYLSLLENNSALITKFRNSVKELQQAEEQEKEIREKETKLNKFQEALYILKSIKSLEKSSHPELVKAFLINKCRQKLEEIQDVKVDEMLNNLGVRLW
eukprot:snap_masked-scaffold_8-processed-gene-1.12-mRNA-1 protein AED:1.00 eAED:1.00 QI:0/-1/0/0/-1/1/1/0/185